GWFFGLINIAVFFAKVAVVIFLFMWVRWTLPRFRWDQLMRLGWLFFFEIALVNIFVVAGLLALLAKKLRNSNGETPRKKEIRMTKPEGNTNSEARKRDHRPDNPGIPCFVIDSSLVICHSSFSS